MDFQTTALTRRGQEIPTRYLIAAGSRIICFGHSLMQGGGSSDIPQHGFGHLLAAMLRASLINYARGGAVVTWPEQTGAGTPGGSATGSGGWAYVLQTVVRPTHVVGEPYIPPPYTALVCYGLNDLGVNGNSANNQANFLDAMRVVLSRLSASMVYEDSDASCAYGTAWAAAANNNGQGSGTTYRLVPATTVNAVLTISVPSDFTGGVIALGFTAQANPAGSVDVAVDGGLATNVSFANRASTTKLAGTLATGFVYRIQNLAAGAHTITVTPHDATAANVYFDYWQVEPTPAPRVLVCNIVRPLTAGYNIYPTPVPTDTDVNNWNAALSNMLAAEFSGGFLLDLDSILNKNAALFFSDALHPNDLGQITLAGGCFDKLLNFLPYLSSTTVANQAREIRDTSKVSVWTIPSATNPGVFAVTSTTITPVKFGGQYVEVQVPAYPGDLLEIGANMLWDNSGTANGGLDIGIINKYMPPPNFTSFSLTTGGTLVNGTTYYYGLTVTNAQGETVSTAPMPVVAGTGGAVILNWGGIAGSTSFKVYRGTSPTALGLVATVASGTTYTDTGAAAGAAPPTANTADGGVYKYLSSGAVPPNSLSPVGILASYAMPTQYVGTLVPFFWTVQPGDVTAGGLILRLFARVSAASTRNLYVSNTITSMPQFWAKNHGPSGGFVDRVT